MATLGTRAREEAFVARCRTTGLALTPQRLAIFRHLAATDTHPSAEALHAAVRRELASVSLATIYKTLDTLADIGAVRPVSRLGTRGRWDANLAPHHHLVCTQCGAIIEFENCDIEHLQDQVAARHGFTISTHKLELYGRCKQCKR